MFHASPKTGLIELTPQVALDPAGEPFFPEHGAKVYLATDLAACLYWLDRIWSEKRSTDDWTVYQVTGIYGEIETMDGGQVAVDGRVTVIELFTVTWQQYKDFLKDQWNFRDCPSFAEWAKKNDIFQGA